MHAAGAQSHPRVAPLWERLFGALRPGDDRLEFGDLVRICETGAQVFVGFRVLLGRGINRREGKLAACCTGSTPSSSRTQVDPAERRSGCCARSERVAVRQMASTEAGPARDRHLNPLSRRE